VVQTRLGVTNVGCQYGLAIRSGRHNPCLLYTSTLRATIDWSYELLSQDEQVLFARLSIFSGGCTLDASEDICDASLDVLDSLAAKSLVVRSSDRVVMLESLREYASERLEASGELTDLRTRHSQYFLRLSLIHI